MHPTISDLLARTRIAGRRRRAHRGALAQTRRGPSAMARGDLDDS
jgi:hypothetical protein